MNSGIPLFAFSQQALDEKFAAIEEKDNEIHQLQLSLREKERDLDRLNNLLSHNEETINVSDYDYVLLENKIRNRDLTFTVVSNELLLGCWTSVLGICLLIHLPPEF